MKRRLLLLLPIIAGCTTPLTPGQLAARAMIEPTSSLCAVVVLSPGPDAVRAAEDEIASRHATCDWDEARAIAQVQIQRKQAEADAQQARQQANAAALMGASAALLQQSGPRYYAPAPTQTTCIQQGVFLNCNSY